MSKKQQSSGWFWSGFFALFFFGMFLLSPVGIICLIYGCFAINKYFRGGK